MKRSEFWSHLFELRRTLLLILFVVVTGFVTTFFFHEKLLSLLLSPLPETSYIQLSPLDGFLIALKLSFWSALVLTAPLWLYLVAKFIAPGLYNREKKALLLLLPLTLIFMSSGLLFAYKLTLPLVVKFLSGFTVGTQMWALTNTVNFVLSILVAHALCFEIFALLFVLVHYGIVQSHHLSRARRYVIIGIFILAAIFTPPDVASQLLLVCPLWILYEGVTLYGSLRSKG